jgi:hypothetical protein
MMKTNTLLIILAFLVSALELFNSGCSSSGKKGVLTRTPTGKPEELEHVHSLKEVMAGNYFGFDLEADEYQTSLKQQAEKFIQYRTNYDIVNKSRKTPIPKKVQKTINAATAVVDDYQKDCAKSASDKIKNPYCSFLQKYREPLPDDGPVEGQSIKGGPREKQRQYVQFRKKLKIGDIKDFDKLSAGAIRDILESTKALCRGLKNCTRLEPINSLAVIEKSIQEIEANPCNNARLSYYVGLKIEEFFPDMAMRQRAVSVYGKVAECKHEVYQPAAKYRLSLLKIWDGKCNEVIKDLKFLTAKDNRKTYRSRGLYWTYYCQKQLGDESEANRAAQTLLDDHPFSLHTLLVDKAYSGQLRIAANRPDSPLRFRSSSNRSPVNNALLAAEGLLSLKKKIANPLVSEILTSVKAQMEDLEPEVQLYAALLFNRAVDNVGKFKVLTTLFIEHSEMISRQALEVYYPLHDLNNKVMERVGLDEFLVISLIRQESAFNEMAMSGAPAMGLMQVTPATARMRKSVAMRKLFNADLNVRLGSDYFAMLMRKYSNDAELALAAYNAGPEPVDAWRERYPVSNRVLMVDLFPYRETREYVGHIARNYYWYTVLYNNQAGVNPPVEQGAAIAPEALPSNQIIQDVTAHLVGVFKLFGS